MTYMPYKPGKALMYAVLVWLIGFIWGTIIFMTPALKNIQAIPYVSKYPAVSFPLIAAYFIILFIFAGKYLEDTDKKAAEGLKLGMSIFLVNIILMSILLPWFIGRRLERKHHDE